MRQETPTNPWLPEDNPPPPPRRVQLMVDYGAFPLRGDDGMLRLTTLLPRPESIKRLKRWARVYEARLTRADPPSVDSQPDDE